MTDRSVYVRLKADVSQYQRDMLKAEASTKSLSHRLDEADGRMSGLIQTGLALAPALIPIGAVAVPAVAALATQLGIAGAAAGVTMLAFNGVGKGLEALNKYQLDPTAANFKALQSSLQGLGPEAQNFIGYLQSIRPELGKLRQAAQGGLLPGAQQGLEELMKIAPLAETVIGHMAVTVGKLLAEAGDNLNDPRWKALFLYMDREAQPILTNLGHTLGNVFAGIANVLGDFMPLTADFSTGMLNMSRDFRKWSEELGSSQGFANFVEYVRSSGPAVLDTLGSLAGAILAIVEAGAPVGRILLPVIGELADGIATLAHSPLGPVMISAAAAVGVLGRSLALLKAVGLKGGTSFIQRDYVQPSKNVVTAFRDMRKASEQLRAAEAQRATAATRARDAQFAMIPDKAKRQAVHDYTTAIGQQKAAEEKLSEAEKTRSHSMRTMAGSFGKAAAVAGGLALATSGVADKFSLSNTASMAMMGLIGGPWGAAIGGGIGLVMDLAKASHHSAVSTDELSATLNAQNGALTDNTRKMMAKKLADSGAFDAAGSLGLSLSTVTEAALGNSSALAEVRKATAGAAGEQGAYIMTGNGMVQTDSKRASAARILNRIMTDTGGTFADARKKIRDMKLATDQSAAANRGASNSLHTESMSLDELITRLDKANSATLTNRGSMRDYKAAVDAARQSLKQNGKTLDDNTEKGRANNAALDAIASAAIKHAGTMRDDGKAINKVNGYLQQSRQDLIKAAEHFGMTRKQAINYTNSVLKIPKDARTQAIFDHQMARSQIKDYVKYVNDQLQGGVHDKTVKLIMDAQSSHIRSELSWLRKAGGGDIHGPGTGTSDSIPALLSDNEHVVTNAEVRAFGKGSYERGHQNIKMWRQAALQGELPMFAGGGTVLRAQTVQKPPPAGTIIRADSAAFSRMAASISGQLSGAVNQAIRQAASSIGGGLHRPVNGGVITQGIHDAYTGFPAIDFGVPVGTPVHAGASGRVAISRDLLGPGGYRSYGRYIQLDNGKFSTLYAHLSQRRVQAGQLVAGGQLIGISGNTGNSTGPHLHFGARGISPRRFLHDSGGGIASVGSYHGQQGHLSPGQAQAAAKSMMPSSWSWPALRVLWNNESGWRWNADNPNSSAYGIPQALPGSKMGAGWHDNAAAQIRWGLGYIRSVYGSPSNALRKWQSRSPHWYAKGGEVRAVLEDGEHVVSKREVAGMGGHDNVAAWRQAARYHNGGPVRFAKGGPVTAPTSVTRDISARITQMRNALDTSKFYHTLVPYIRHRLSGKQEQTYLDRAHRAFTSDMKRNDMDRIRAATTALRKSDTPNKDYARLVAFIRHNLTGREERDRLRMARDAHDANVKKTHDAQLAAAHKKHADAINKVTTELNKLRSSAKNLRDQRNALVTQIGSSFVSDPFQGTLGGFHSQLGYENKRMYGAGSDLFKLAQSHMSKSLISQLASSGNASLIHQFAQLSPKQLASEQALWDRRNRLQRQVGVAVGDRVYGADTKALQHRIDKLTEELRRLRHGGGSVHFHGKVVARDAEGLAKKIHKKTQTAARLARHR